MKKIISLLAAAATLLFTFSATALAFSDVTESTAYSMEIYWLANNNVINGYPDGTFKPNATVNRAEMLKIVFLALGLSAEVEAARLEMTVANIGFPDVKLDQWYAPYVYLAKKRGSVQGYPDGTFKPGNPVKRGEAFKIALNEFYNNQIQFAGVSEITDVPSDAWFWKYANFAGSYDLFDGIIFNGGMDMTRASTAQLVYRTKAVKDNSAGVYTVLLFPDAIEGSGASTGTSGGTSGSASVISAGGTTTVYTEAQLLAKVEAVLLDGYSAINIQQAGSNVFFYAFDNNASEPIFSWYQLSLTEQNAQEIKLYGSGSPINLIRGAANPDGSEFLVTAEDGKLVLHNTFTHGNGTLATFTFDGSARYISPAYTPDGRYIILHDRIDSALVVIDASTKNVNSPVAKVSGFWLLEGGGGGFEHGYTYSTGYTFLSNDRVEFWDRVLNLSTMSKE